MRIKINQDGTYAFYDIEIHGEVEESMEINEELYAFLLENNGLFIFDMKKVKEPLTKEMLKEVVFEEVPVIGPTLEERIEAVEAVILEMI